MAGADEVKRIENEWEIVSGLGPFRGKVVIDVGCGTGGMVRKLSSRGATVIGIDTRDMIQKAGEKPGVGGETYLVGGGEALPFEDDFADMILFLASLHHVPADNIPRALNESHRVLKRGGLLLCLEPVGEKGSYFELIRLLEDEREVQAATHEVIRGAEALGLSHVEEYMAFFERSFQDYVNLMNVFVNDESKRNECLIRGREITARLCAESGIAFGDYRFKSMCRVNILRKV
jgi:ubiquinone/menaquinone biosynthesis C-methylase UbiE